MLKEEKMKITVKQLRQIIREQSQNPGSRFSSARKKGDEASDQKQIDRVSEELQKTVDWFESVVFPAIESNSFPITIDSQYLAYAEPGFGSQDMYIIDEKILSLDQKLKLSSSESDEKLTIGQIYDELEQTVINQPELKVRMQSDAGSALDVSESIRIKITHHKLAHVIREELNRALK